MGFRSIQAANLSGWDGKKSSEAFERFLVDISRVLGMPPAKAAEEQRRQVESEPKPKAEEKAERVREQAVKEEAQQRQVEPETVQAIEQAPSGLTESSNATHPSRWIAILAIAVIGLGVGFFLFISWDTERVAQ